MARNLSKLGGFGELLQIDSCVDIKYGSANHVFLKQIMFWRLRSRKLRLKILVQLWHFEWFQKSASYFRARACPNSCKVNGNHKSENQHSVSVIPEVCISVVMSSRIATTIPITNNTACCLGCVRNILRQHQWLWYVYISVCQCIVSYACVLFYCECIDESPDNGNHCANLCNRKLRRSVTGMGWLTMVYTQ